MTLHIVSQKSCSYCEKAIDLAKEKGYSINEVKLEDEPFIKALLAAKGFKTVPQIWIDTDYIGGYTEFKAFVEGEAK